MQTKSIKTNVKPFVFVLMPFHPDFDDIYQVGIKAACQAVGAYCERVDEQIFGENILDRVYNQIAKADIIVAEMTGRNPNVFYETGYAHALNKRVILLTKSADDIPSDLKLHPHVVYHGKIVQLKTELEKRVKWYIDNPTNSLTNVDLDFELLINGATWQEGLEVEIPCQTDDYLPFEEDTSTDTGKLCFSLQIGSHNISNTVIEEHRYHIGLIIPRIFAIGRNSDIDTATLKGENTVLRLLGFRTVFPDAWNSARINFVVKKQDLPNLSTEFILKLFSELGVKDYKFKLNLVPIKGS